MKKKIVLLGSFIIIIGALVFSSAQAVSYLDDNGNPVVVVNRVCDSNSMTDVTGIINWGSCLLIKTIIPFLFSLATVAFIWGVIQYYLNPDNEEKRKKGKSFIIGGLIALFVMLSVWGIVKVLTTTFDLNSTLPQLPQ